MTAHGVRAPSRARLVVLVAVALGGALGALLRHGIDVVVPVADRGFPWPTLVINVTGSAALAALGASAGVQRRPVLRGFLGPGLLGGYTTLSAYAEQGRRLLAADQAWLALCYLLATLAGCMAACLGAAALVRRSTSGGAAADGSTAGGRP